MAYRSGKNRDLYLYSSAGCILAVFCLSIAVVAAGGGHGTYLWAKIFFPYTMLQAQLIGSIATLPAALAVLQFPAYGLALGLSVSRHAVGRVAVALVTIHSLGIILCFAAGAEVFS